MNFNMSTDQ